MAHQVKPSHYNNNYDTKERFCSYWHQIHEIVSLNPKKVLEIGVGNSFVSNYLKQKGFNVVSVDIDRKLRPNLAGSILNIPFSYEKFDVVACYEVLEHLPYVYFEKAISEIFRVSSLHALLSLPDANRCYRIQLQIPKIGYLKKLIPSPYLKKPIHHFDGQHYWEIGKNGYPLSKIIADITKAKFNVIETYRIFEIPYHRFFQLKK